jgi:5-methylcytosine-specific restriction endonuclease McrA
MLVASTSHALGAVRPLSVLSDDALLLGLNRLLAQSRRVESELVAHIAEVDARRLWAREAFPSMFAYCTGALHLSESEAYLRIAVGRASREHPSILRLLAEGRLHLSGIALLAPHLTRENCDGLLRRATHRSKREIEELVAELRPRPDAPSLIRKIPGSGRDARAGTPTDRGEDLALLASVSPAGGGEPIAARASNAPSTPSGMGRSVTNAAQPPLGRQSAANSSPPWLAAGIPPTSVRSVVQPLAPGRYKVQFTASDELRGKLERLRALMRSQVPDGDLGAIIEAAVSEKLERLEARRFGATRRGRPQASPRSDASPAVPLTTAKLATPAVRGSEARSGARVGSTSSRHIPARVRRAIRRRDGDRCAFVDANGRRCGERDRLEYHHRRPFALGGDHATENIALMCRAHNLLLAEQDYGRKAIDRFRRRLAPPGNEPSSTGETPRLPRQPA